MLGHHLLFVAPIWPSALRKYKANAAPGAKVRQLPFYALQSWMKTNILLFPSHASYCTQKDLTLVTAAPSSLSAMLVLFSRQLVAAVTPSLRTLFRPEVLNMNADVGCWFLLDMQPLPSLFLNLVTEINQNT